MMNAETFENLIDTKFKSLVDTLRNSVMGEFKKGLDSIANEFSHSMEFLSAELKDALKKLAEAHQDIQYLKTENSALSLKVADLTSRVASAEQTARECNVEIDCVPEHRNENVLEIVKQIASTVSYELTEDKIRSCYRVSKINKDSPRPRSIVVKLPSSRCRDDLLAAVKSFNTKTPSAERLNSKHVGLKGDKRLIYVSEHLSPLNKSLHAATRLAVKEKGYKYCWIRNGQIFVRKNDVSPSILIKNNVMINQL
ncbi:hypothetical protein JYU34_006251 [Plutella xylostella]|uniref:FP protein C-terminal domain-containing protein n=1 Tax=Plutella xylostella TaxID=51655 RepID=A0ABQ7QRK3_PLUXY|nr:hypothetical protein JYU34_006251 [Plutella xylostella]